MLGFFSTGSIITFNRLYHCFFILIAPVLFILKQPDLGTSLLVTASGCFVIFLAGLGWRFIIGSFISAGALIPVFWSMLHDYQRRRVQILIDPTQDPLGAGYHIIQSTIAQGSGGLTGKGWLNGTQSQLDFYLNAQPISFFCIQRRIWHGWQFAVIVIV